MFFLLKLLLHFLRPLIWILLLFLYGLLGKNANRKKLALRIAFGMLLFFTNPFIIGRLLSAYELDPVQLGSTQRFSTGIVLGGFASYSAIDKKGYFNNAADRFIQTALLYKQGKIQNILIAAGHNTYIAKDFFSESGYIKENLVKLGVPAEKIFIESKSQNTRENARFAKQLSDSASLGGPYLLISSAMHLRRASIAFQKEGFNPVLYPCHFVARGGINNILEDCLIPSSYVLNDWDMLIREMIGLAVYQIRN